MPFEITPAQPGMPPVTPGTMPQYLQLRADGVDLGAADADTIDFVGLSATRGVGENAGVVVVTAPPAGSSVSCYALSLSGAAEGASDSKSITVWTPVERALSDDIAWNATDHLFEFLTDGVYDVHGVLRLTFAAFSESSFMVLEGPGGAAGLVLSLTNYLPSTAVDGPYAGELTLPVNFLAVAVGAQVWTPVVTITTISGNDLNGFTAALDLTVLRVGALA